MTLAHHAGRLDARPWPEYSPPFRPDARAVGSIAPAQLDGQKWSTAMRITSESLTEHLYRF